jgi:hypothetical protein
LWLFAVAVIVEPAVLSVTVEDVEESNVSDMMVQLKLMWIMMLFVIDVLT